MGGTVYEITCYSAKDDYNMLKLRRDGAFSIRLNSLRSYGCAPYKSSPRLAMAIGDWLLNFTNAEPGACRTIQQVFIATPRVRGAASMSLLFISGGNYFSPADLFESVWGRIGVISLNEAAHENDVTWFVPWSLYDELVKTPT